MQEIEVARFGGGPADTILHPIVLVAMLVTIVLVLTLSRKYAIVPFLLSAFLIPMSQVVVVGGTHLMVIRIVILFGWVRMGLSKLSSKESILPGGLNSIDKVFILWAILRAGAGVLQFMELAAVINQVGFIWDAIGGYFLLRFLIEDKETIARSIKALSVATCFLGAAMLNEKLRAHNIFGYLGGVSITPDVREGAIRAKGPFAHAILAGVFAGTLIPLFLYLWQSGRSKFYAIVGVAGSTVMVLSSASSTPLLAWVASFFGAFLWPFRRKMRTIRWGIVVSLVVLQLLMKAPVWFIISHVDLVPGNSSYHRAVLIDSFIRHFGDWWLMGVSATGTWGFEMWDLINEFVAQGELGGLAALICFIMTITRGYKLLGNARTIVEGDRDEEWLMWLLGVSLFSHLVGFFGISYFDQTRVSWFALFGMISAATFPILKPKLTKPVVTGLELSAKSNATSVKEGQLASGRLNLASFI